VTRKLSVSLGAVRRSRRRMGCGIVDGLLTFRLCVLADFITAIAFCFFIRRFRFFYIF
jgi:hypothetical protein